MKPMKLTSLVMMLLIAFSAAAQEEFFDDVYFSSKNKKKKEQVEEKKVVQPKQESRTLVATAKSQASSDSRDVDEYNRRYTSVGRSLIVRMIPLSMRIAMRMSLLPSVVRILNIRNVSFVIIRRVRLRSPERIKSICI